MYVCCVSIHTSDPSDVAFPGMDFDFQNITNGTLFFNFSISAGSTRSFPLTIIDDSVAEYRHQYHIGIYDDSYCDYGDIAIEDNDGGYYYNYLLNLYTHACS